MPVKAERPGHASLMVPAVGLEPTHPHGYKILSLVIHRFKLFPGVFHGSMILILDH